MHDGSTNLTAAYLNIRDNTQDGIRVESGSEVLDLGYSTMYHNGFGGVFNSRLRHLRRRADRPPASQHGDLQRRRRHRTLNDPAQCQASRPTLGAQLPDSGCAVNHHVSAAAGGRQRRPEPRPGKRRRRQRDDGHFASGTVQVLGNTVSNTHGVFGYGIYSPRAAPSRAATWRQRGPRQLLRHPGRRPDP